MLSPPTWDEQDRRKESNVSAATAFDDRRRESAFDNMRRDSAFNSALSKHDSMFDNPRSNFFEDRSIFDRERSGSLFDRDDRSLFAANSEQNGVSRVQYDDDTYKILVNVADFRPEDIIVKTVGGNVQLEAKREEKTADGHSFSSRDDADLEDQI